MDERSPDTPIAVDERMDCLELCVRHRRLDDRGEVVGVAERAEIVQEIAHPTPAAA